MKFWQLVSVLRSEADSAGLRHVLSDSKWRKYAEWYVAFDAYVDAQDRSVLDAIVPDELCRSAIALSAKKYQLVDGWLRSSDSMDSGAGAPAPMSALDVYSAFGGEVLEEVGEYGSAQPVRRP